MTDRESVIVPDELEAIRQRRQLEHVEKLRRQMAGEEPVEQVDADA